MSEITIYTKTGCPYCARAKQLLAKKGAKWTEIVAADNPAKKAEMIARANGGRTFPQIFIGGTHVGGSDDLYELDARGGLDPMLAAHQNTATGGHAP